MWLVTNKRMKRIAAQHAQDVIALIKDPTPQAKRDALLTIARDPNVSKEHLSEVSFLMIDVVLET